jgi:hypothetical protein
MQEFGGKPERRQRLDKKKTCEDKRVILKWIFRKKNDQGRCGLDCCGTGQGHRDKCGAILIMVMNIRVP